MSPLRGPKRDIGSWRLGTIRITCKMKMSDYWSFNMNKRIRPAELRQSYSREPEGHRPCSMEHTSTEWRVKLFAGDEF